MIRVDVADVPQLVEKARPACLTTAPRLPAWCLPRLSPRQHSPERRLSSLEARRGLSSTAQLLAFEPRSLPTFIRQVQKKAIAAARALEAEPWFSAEHMERVARPSCALVGGVLVAWARCVTQPVGKRRPPCLRTAPPSARLGFLTARAAPTHSSAPPRPLGSVPWPPQLG